MGYVAMKAGLVVVFGLLQAIGSIVGLAVTVIVVGELFGWWDLL